MYYGNVCLIYKHMNIWLKGKKQRCFITLLHCCFFVTKQKRATRSHQTKYWYTCTDIQCILNKSWDIFITLHFVFHPNTTSIILKRKITSSFFFSLIWCKCVLINLYTYIFFRGFEKSLNEKGLSFYFCTATDHRVFKYRIYISKFASLFYRLYSYNKPYCHTEFKIEGNAKLVCIYFRKYFEPCFIPSGMNKTMLRVYSFFFILEWLCIEFNLTEMFYNLNLSDVML